MQARKEEMEVRWIDQVLDPDNLRLAWEEVAERKGAAGIDRVSIKRWRRNWEERLVELALAVKTNTYTPRRLRRFSIPKKDGTRRQLAILTVTDRVLQRAVLRVVAEVFDRRFYPCSFGYRSGRGVRDAVPLILAYRNEGRQWVLDADIDNCFGSLDLALIRQFFAEEIHDPIVLRLLDQWLAIGDEIGKTETGIALGSVLSPLFCNLVLHRLDYALSGAGFFPVRYADDFCVFCANRAEAENARELARDVLALLHLRLEPAKTRITHFDEGFDFLGVHFHRDAYSFICRKKRVEVKGGFDREVLFDYVPDGYV
jgi:group II intron reverse transcriptase/maturase